MSKFIPTFKWAENDEKIFLTVELGGVSSDSVQINENSFKLNHKDAAGKEYEIDLKLKGTVDPASSKYACTGRQVEVVLAKKEPLGWWNQLAADKHSYKQHMKIDWDLWRDEDEEDKPVDEDFGGGGMGGMGGGMGGMGGGMGGMGNMMNMMGGGGMGGMGGGGMGGMDFSQMMAGMGGAPGAGGPEGEEGDSDDEDLPELETAPPAADAAAADDAAAETKA